MEHEPCGLLSHAKSAVQFIAVMPFLQFESSHMAGSHLSRPMGESSKMVPTLSENFCLGASP